MTLWELHDGRQQIGPLDEEHVVRMIFAGLPPTTWVRRAGDPTWVALSTYYPFAMAIERMRPPPSLVIQGHYYPQQTGTGRSLAGRTASSAVRIVGMLVFLCGAVGMIPGCAIGGPVGAIAMAVIAIVGLVLMRVE